MVYRTKERRTLDLMYRNDKARRIEEDEKGQSYNKAQSATLSRLWTPTTL